VLSHARSAWFDFVPSRGLFGRIVDKPEVNVDCEAVDEVNFRMISTYSHICKLLIPCSGADGDNHTLGESTYVYTHLRAHWTSGGNRCSAKLRRLKSRVLLYHVRGACEPAVTPSAIHRLTLHNSRHRPTTLGLCRRS